MVHDGECELNGMMQSAGSCATLRDNSDAMLFGSGDESLALLATSRVQRLMSSSEGRGPDKHASGTSGAPPQPFARGCGVFS
jgi:hypothetical protein